MEQLIRWRARLQQVRLEPQTLIEFLQALAELLETGLDLSNALSLVGDMLPGKTIKKSCEQQVAWIMGGGDWHEALACDKIIWPKPTLAWIRIAMHTGDIPLCLRTHIAELTGELDFQKALFSKLSYPLIVLLSSTVLAYFMHTQLAIDAPMYATQPSVITPSDGLLVLGGLLATAAAVWMLQARFKHVSPLRTKTWCRCCCALSAMLQCGQSLQQSLDKLLWDLKHLWIKTPEIGESLYQLSQLIAEGESLKTALTLSGWPGLMTRAATTAEASGDLVALFNQSARILEIKAKAMQQRLLAWIPILAMVCAAATLAGLYISQIKPLYDNLVTQEIK